MLIKALAVAIVTLTLTVGTAAQPSPFNRWTRFWYKNFLCSDIWMKEDGMFEVERIPEMRVLVGDRKVDVGTCPVGSCSDVTYIHNFDCDESRGRICPVTETETVVYADYGTHEYEKVTKCICCKDEGIMIKASVVDSQSGEPLEEIRILVNNAIVGETNEDGLLEVTVPTAEQFVIKSEDVEDREYLNAVQIVDIPAGFGGPVEVELQMNKKAEAVEIDSTEEVTLSLSSDPSNPDLGHAQIVIESDSFRRTRGFWSARPYRGTVKASVTYLNLNENAEDAIPGRFQTSVDGVREGLITDGVVNFEFTEPNGNPLRMRKPIKFIVRKDMRMWILNEVTGLWEPTGDSPSNRGKRQVTLTDEYLVNINNGQWVNIDKIPGAPRCYFKGRIFDAATGTEIQSSATASFRPQILAYTNQNQRLRMYTGYTSTPSDTCFEVRCPDVSDPDDALTGFINMTSVESVSIGGVLVPYTTYLTPRNLAGYTLPIQNRHSAVQYAIAPNGLDVFVNFVSNAAGPFYTVKNACDNSPVQQPAFHFFKPDLPSYTPAPNDTDICTARIGFMEEGNSFFDYLYNATNLPNMTGISVWTENGTDFYFTETVQIELSTNDSDPFAYACLRYRCSEENAPTTVYLDIQTPNNTYYYNYTFPNGTIVEMNETYQAFNCYGNCVGRLCNQWGHGFAKRAAEGPNTQTIDGSFVAPDDASAGTDFYESGNSNCAAETSSDPFAYSFYCYSNGQYYGEEYYSDF